MRNLFKYITFIVLSIPFLAFATPVSWDYTTNLLQPLISGRTAEVKVPYVTSTSTTNNNTLPRLVATNATTTYATTTNLALTTAFNLFGGGVVTTNNALCIQLTGSASLCDGSDASGSGGGSNWLFDGTRLTPSTTVGIGIFASSTISNLSITNATTSNATSSNQHISNKLSFGGVSGSAWTDFCTSITGSADLCDGNDGGGGGSSKWTDGTNFTYLTNTTYDLGLGSTLATTSPFWWDVSASQMYVGSQGSADGMITFGTTTPWTIGFDDTDDSFAISSSTSLGTFNALTITSTTSVMNATTSTGSRNDMGVRLGIGGDDSYLGLDQPLDHVTLRGRMRNQDWVNYSCYQGSQVAQGTADGVFAVCPEWYFAEDGTSYVSFINSTGYSYSQLGSITANDGAMVTLHSASNAANWMTLATNTPSMEVTARLGTIVSNSSTTNYYIGYLPYTINVTVLETQPSTGCFFWVASSTAGAIATNWLATCKTSNTATTTVDTGIASTSIATGAGNWNVFRIDATGTEVNFYIKPGSQAMRKVATISTNIPQTALSPMVAFGRVGGTGAIQFDFHNIDLWLRKVYPLNT